MNYNFKSVLFLGIGGVSMHQLAICFKNLGVKVVGYDAKENEYTNKCKQNEILVTNKFDKNFLNVDLCVKTSAIKENDKYVKVLKKLNVPVVDRAEVLGWLSSKFKNVIAVAGTHGKSTTASLIYEILRIAGKNVSCHIGANVLKPKFDIKDDYLVVEACEFNKSFLWLFPTISVVTNVEAEHLDSYGNFFNLKNAFSMFLKRGRKRFVTNEKSTQFLKKIKNVDFVDIEESFNTKLKGEYNLKNISLAVAVARSLKIEECVIKKVVESFNGIPRRYELLGNVNETKIFIDYAHHPTEVNAFSNTFQKEFENCLIVFQPHTYSRTKNLFKEFVLVLSKVENLVIFKEYPAREDKSQGKSALELFNKLEDCDCNVTYAENIKSIAKRIEKYSAVAFVGAGDINLVAKKLLESKQFKDLNKK